VVGKLVEVGCVVLLALLAMSVPAHARQFDMSNDFNADVIVNGTTAGNIDETQAPVDISETSFITQRAARVLDDCTDDPDGLPPRGLFPPNNRHPKVNLAYANRRNGKNARRSLEGDRYRVATPHRRFRSVHVFATTGNGDATMRVKLLYRGGTKVREFEVVDWFEDIGDGYMLVDDRDRAQPDASECFDDDAPAIRGFKVKAREKQRLRAVKLIRPANDSSSVLNVFGMTGVRAK
jgi:hypothetical protein